MRNSFKHTLIISLVYCFSIGNALAMTIDEYEDAKDRALESFRREVEVTLRNEDAIGREHVREGFMNALSFARIDINNMTFFMETTVQETNDAVAPLDLLAEKIKNSSAGSLTLENYGSILQSYLAYEQGAAGIKNNIAALSSVYNEYLKYEKDFDNVCDVAVPGLTKPKLSLPPNPEWDVAYDKITSFATDPVTKVYFETALASSFLASLLTYYLLYGTKATMALFGVTASGGEYIISSTGPAGALILAIVVVVAVSVAKWKEQAENNERKRRAEKADKKLIEGIDAIKAKFESERQTQEEFQQMGMEICRNSQTTGELSKIKASYLETKDKIAHQLTMLKDIKASIDTNWLALGRVVGLFADGLRTKFRESILAEYRDGIISTEKTTKAANIYNDDVLPLSREASQFFIKQRDNCLVLQDYYANMEYEINSYREDILKLRDNNNTGKGIFIDVEQRLSGILGNFKTRLDRCNNSNQNGGGILAF